MVKSIETHQLFISAYPIALQNLSEQQLGFMIAFSEALLKIAKNLQAEYDDFHKKNPNHPKLYEIAVVTDECLANIESARKNIIHFSNSVKKGSIDHQLTALDNIIQKTREKISHARDKIQDLMAADPEPSLYQKFLTILDNALNKLASIASAIKNYVVQTTSRLLTFSHTRPAAELGTRSAPTV